MKLIVLGGGQQGRVIAGDLARSLPAAEVVVADVAPRPAKLEARIGWIEADLSDATILARTIGGADLAVGALPSHLGDLAMRAAIDARRPLVDVAFAPEDPLRHDRAARDAGIAIVPDCGLAPGLSHLFAGRLLEAGAMDDLTILVGGVAADPDAPYGYVVTWSVDDLLEEYVRPARVVRDGRVVERPAFEELETLEIEGLGTMEAFLSDGLRTLLALPDPPRSMSEKTLRWPGHAAQVRPLVERGTLVAELLARCSADPPRDVVALSVRARRGGVTEEIAFVDRYDPASRLTAMARTTALTTASVARLAAGGGVRGSGVLPLERLAGDAGVFEFVSASLAERGIAVAHRTLAADAASPS